MYIPPDGGGTNAALENKLLASLRHDPAIDQITLTTAAEVDVNGRSVRTAAFSPARGPAQVVHGRAVVVGRVVQLGHLTAAALPGRGPGGARPASTCRSSRWHSRR